MLNAVFIVVARIVHIEIECPYHLFTFEIMMMIIMWPKLPDESELKIT
jgi:hypothetical protein